MLCPLQNSLSVVADLSADLYTLILTFGKYYLALKGFRSLISHSKMNDNIMLLARSWIGLGCSFHGLSKFDDALESYNKALFILRYVCQMSLLGFDVPLSNVFCLSQGR